MQSTPQIYRSNIQSPTQHTFVLLLKTSPANSQILILVQNPHGIWRHYLCECILADAVASLCSLIEEAAMHLQLVESEGGEKGCFTIKPRPTPIHSTIFLFFLPFFLFFFLSIAYLDCLRLSWSSLDFTKTVSSPPWLRDANSPSFETKISLQTNTTWESSQGITKWAANVQKELLATINCVEQMLTWTEFPQIWCAACGSWTHSC